MVDLDDHLLVDHDDDDAAVEEAHILHENAAAVHLALHHDRDHRSSQKVAEVVVDSRRTHPSVEVEGVHLAWEVAVHTQGHDLDVVHLDTFLHHNHGVFLFHVEDYPIYPGIGGDHDRYDVVDSLIGTGTDGAATANTIDFGHDDDGPVHLLHRYGIHETGTDPFHFDY